MYIPLLLRPLAFATAVSASAHHLQETINCLFMGMYDDSFGECCNNNRDYYYTSDHYYSNSDQICNVAKCVDVSASPGIISVKDDPTCNCDILVDVCNTASSLLSWVSPDLSGLCATISGCCSSSGTFTTTSAFNGCWQANGANGVNAIVTKLNGEGSGVLSCLNSGSDIGTCCASSYDPISQKICGLVNCIDLSTAPGSLKYSADCSCTMLVEVCSAGSALMESLTMELPTLAGLCSSVNTCCPSDGTRTAAFNRCWTSKASLTVDSLIGDFPWSLKELSDVSGAYLGASVPAENARTVIVSSGNVEATSSQAAASGSSAPPLQG
ncbi:hypothetical protein HJC23_004598 [Cyclotella cryptica]|uniref:Uncharacterized protein n=1 Tax=Cyclotella cryptica TaxID=29204 RepID=A0ABD3QM82_9STRA